MLPYAAPEAMGEHVATHVMSLLTAAVNGIFEDQMRRLVRQAGLDAGCSWGKDCRYGHYYDPYAKDACEPCDAAVTAE